VPQDRSDHDLLIEMNTKLDLLVNSDADKETRIRSLERARYTLAGMAALGGGALGVIGQRIHF